MTVREVIKMLIKDGWYQVVQHGSHMQFEHKVRAEK